MHTTMIIKLNVDKFIGGKISIHKTSELAGIAQMRTRAQYAEWTRSQFSNTEIFFFRYVWI